jgi:hypothetical protein
MQALNQLAPAIGLAPACAALNLSRSSVYREDARQRHLLSVTATPAPRPPAPLAFSAQERQQMLDELDSERFADCSPYFVYATLLDEGRYIGSVRTLHRGPGGGRPIGGAQAPADSPGLCQAGTPGHRAQSGLELGYYETQRARQMDLFPPVCDP